MLPSPEVKTPSPISVHLRFFCHADLFYSLDSNADALCPDCPAPAVKGWGEKSPRRCIETCLCGHGACMECFSLFVFILCRCHCVLLLQNLFYFSFLWNDAKKKRKKNERNELTIARTAVLSAQIPELHKCTVLMKERGSVEATIRAMQRAGAGALQVRCVAFRFLCFFFN